MVPVPWLLPDLQKIINDYLTGHKLYNKLIAEYKTKIQYEEEDDNHECRLTFGRGAAVAPNMIGWVCANYRDVDFIIADRNIYSFTCTSRDSYLDIMGVLPLNY